VRGSARTHLLFLAVLLAALLLPAVVLATLLGCGRPGAESGTADAAVVTVTVVRPARRTLVRSLKVPGGIEAFQEATLYAKTAGYLSKITVDRGDRVRRGQVLATISVPEMGGEHDVAEATLREAEAALDLKKVTAERTREVYAAEAGAVTRQQVDQAEAELTEVESKVARLKAELARLETLMDYATIRAPFDGIITDRFVDPGAMIQLATSSAQAPIVTLMNMDTVRVFAEVSEPDVPFVSRTTPARLTVEVLPGEDFQGTVTRYATALDPKTRTMKTEVDLPNPKHRLRPGMFAVVILELGRREDALTLPAAALLVEKDTPYVFTIVDGTARRTPVTTGISDGIVVEILDGLNGSESVVLAGRGLVTDGMRVIVGGQG
jgi:RND family efflux transporter MFP subunit